ncbi:uncharacterized protein LOC129607174 isoform X4 [Condylostylus longicornis]|uniref:uncharacterized protein LOC129607174 isoform X4 n=1 Tax=Condylostylus longicornis TaxID=2530218 RepID=UPI00244E47B3|nr:uncharacterized protein LOC129607174 isoform X4 [Condylostylus longicornis]
MPRNRKKKNNNNQQKKKNNNNNNNNNNNINNSKQIQEKTLEQNEKCNAVVATDTINANITTNTTANTSTIIIVPSSEEKSTTKNNCIDGNAPILNTTNEKKISEVEFACAIPSVSPIATPNTNIINDTDIHNNDHHQHIHNNDDDASSSSLSAFIKSPSPQHQSTVYSETTIIDESILNNNYKNNNKNISKNDNKEIENKLIKTDTSTSNGNNFNNNSNNVNIEDINNTDTIFIDENSINLIGKTGSSTSKDAQIPNDNDTAGSVTLIRKEKIDREMQIFKDLSKPESSLSSENNDPENESSSSNRDNQLSIQLKSITYHLDPNHESDNNEDSEKEKPTIIKHVKETISEVVSVKCDKSSDNNKISCSAIIESEKIECTEPSFIDSLKSVYENISESSSPEKKSETVSESGNVNISNKNEKLLSNTLNVDETIYDNVSQTGTDVEETFSKIIAEFDKLDDDIDSAFLEISKEDTKSVKNEPEIVIEKNSATKKTTSQEELSIISDKASKPFPISTNLEPKSATSKPSVKIHKITVESESKPNNDSVQKTLSDDNVEETFSEIISKCDKLDKDVEEVFDEISKDETEILKSDSAKELDEMIKILTLEFKSAANAKETCKEKDRGYTVLSPTSLKSSDDNLQEKFTKSSEMVRQLTSDSESKSLAESTEDLNFTVTSPISLKSSDENLRDKASHFVTIEEINEGLSKMQDIEKDKYQTQPVQANFDYSRMNPFLIDNTVTIEDLDEDDDIVILNESDDQNKIPPKDYKTKKNTKRIALQTHFLPQIIEPRYLDCIKEESSDLSDIDKREDSDIVQSSSDAGSATGIGIGSNFDDLEDEVFYDNEIYQKANAVYPKIQLDFSKKKKKVIGVRHPIKADVISEEDIQTIVETKLVEQPSIEEGCSKTWSKNLIPSSEQAEVIYLNSASSSSSDIMDSDNDTKDTKSTNEYNVDEDESETRIKTPTIDYLHDPTNKTLENLTTQSNTSESNTNQDEQKQEQERLIQFEKQQQLQQQKISSPTHQSNENNSTTNNTLNKNNENGEFSERIHPVNEKFNTQKNIDTASNDIHMSSTPVSGIINNFMISQNTKLVSNENLMIKEENLAENFAKENLINEKNENILIQKQLPPTGNIEKFDEINNNNKLSSDTKITTKITETTTTTTKISTSSEEKTTTTELSEKNLNIHNNKINTNKMVNLNMNLSNLEENSKLDGNTLKGILRQESAESHCSAQSHSTVSSQCTAIRKGSPIPPEDNNNATSPTKSLKQICLESLVSMPYGKDVLEELASVSQSLDYLTDKPEVQHMQAAKSEELLNCIDMPYPLPEPPKIHNIEIKFEPSNSQTILNNNHYDSEIPPPLPKLPAELQKFSTHQNYQTYINELRNVTSNNKNSNESLSKIPYDGNLNSNYTKNLENFQESKYNFTSNKNNATQTQSTIIPPPVPPLPSFGRENNFKENYSNIKNENNSQHENNHRLLEIIRSNSVDQPSPKENTNSILSSLMSKTSSSDMKTGNQSSSISTETKKSEKISEIKSSSILSDDKYSSKKFSDFQSPNSRHFNNDDIWKFLNDPNYFNSSSEKFPTSEFDKIFSNQKDSSTSTSTPSLTTSIPAIPKRFSNIETSTFESKKVFQNGKLISEVQNSSHNDRVDENSLSSLKKFISDGNLKGDIEEKWSSNNFKTFKNTSDATDSINKNVATDTTTTEKKPQQTDQASQTSQKQQPNQQQIHEQFHTKTEESRKSDSFSYDEFRQRAKERAESKSKSEIFNSDDIFKEFKRFSENLDRDIAKKTDNLRSNYHVPDSINIPIKIENQPPKQQSSSTHNESAKKTEQFSSQTQTQNEKKEIQIPINFEKEISTKQETKTEKTVHEDLSEFRVPSMNQVKKEFNIPINMEPNKFEQKVFSNPPPPPPPKTEHTIPIHFDTDLKFNKTETFNEQHDKIKDVPMWLGTSKESLTSNISKSQKEVNIPIKIEKQQEQTKTETVSSIKSEQKTSSAQNSSIQTDSLHNIAKEFRIPISVQKDDIHPTSSVPGGKREFNIPIHIENNNKNPLKKDKWETDDELPRSAPATGYHTFDIPIKTELPYAPAHSDEKRRRTYSSSVHEDMYKSDNTSDYWRSIENISSRAATPSLWRSSVDLSSRVSTPSLDKVVRPIEKEVEICLFGKSPKIKAPRLTASTNNLTYYMPCPPEHYNQQPFNYTTMPNRSTSRRKYFTSCQSMIEETPNTPYSQQPHFIRQNQNRVSMGREMNPQAEYIRRKEEELKKEYIALEDEREKLLKDLTQFNETLEKEIYETQLKKNAENRKQLMQELNNFHQMNQNHQPRRRSWNAQSEEEALQQRMRNEWLNKIAEREDRRMHKVIKITKPSDDLQQSSKISGQNVRKLSDTINIGDEFLRRVKERRTKLNMPADSDWESGAESQPIPSKDQKHFMQSTTDYNVKIMENRSEADLKNLPKHLVEFAEFVKKFEEEHKDLGIFENEKRTITNLSNSISNLSSGVWSPNNNETFKVPSDNIIQHQENQQLPEQKHQKEQQQTHHLLTTPPPPPPPPLPSLSIWSPQQSPQQSRKFRPVKFQSPTLQRKYVREGSQYVNPPWISDANTYNNKTNRLQQQKQPFSTNSISASDFAGTQSLSCSSLNNIENNCNRFNNNLNHKNINKFGSTSSLKGKENLQSVHSTGFIKPNEVVYSLKSEYLSEPELNSGHPKKMAQLAHRQIEGIGPTTKDGMPIVLRSEVKQNNQHQWYKKMFQTLHKAKDNDESIVIRYKSPKGRYSYKSNGYMSEPEPYYDSDYSSMKYRSVERKPRTISASSSQNERSYGTLPNPVKPGSDPYKNQPGKIENFTPGHSSVSEKERKDWWDEVMDIFNGHWEQQKLSPHYSEGNLSRALKDHEYDSDSNLIFRKKEQNLQSPLSPIEQKQAYRSVQAGGEPPLLGFRKPAPEKPKGNNTIEYLPITSTLTKIRVYNHPIEMDRRSNLGPSSLISSKSYTMLSSSSATLNENKAIISPPTPPNRNSSKTRSSTTIRSYSETRKQPPNPSDRHYSCFHTGNKTEYEPQANKFGTITLRKHGKRESILQHPTRSKSTGAITSVLTSKFQTKENKIPTINGPLSGDNSRSRAYIRPHSVRISTSISPPSRPTSRLTSLRQSSPSPIAFGRSISKERAFAVEKKRLEETLPLCKRSFASSTNILKDPSLKSPDEVVKAVQSYAHIHPLARSKSVPKTVYSTCSKPTSTFQQSLSSIKKKLSCVDKIHSKYHSNVPKTSVSISREYKISHTPYKPRELTVNKISKSASKTTAPTSTSNLSLARSNSTYSIDSTGSKKILRKPITSTRSKSHEPSMKQIPPPPPMIQSTDGNILKKVAQCFSKSETSTGLKKLHPETNRPSNAFFQNLFLHDSSITYEDEEFDLQPTASVQERARYFNTFSEKSDRPILFTGRYLTQKKPISSSKFVSYQSRSLSPTYRREGQNSASEQTQQVSTKLRTIHQVSDDNLKKDDECEVHEKLELEFTKRTRTESGSKFEHDLPYYDDSNAVKMEKCKEIKRKSFSPTREVRIHPKDSRSFSPTHPPLASQQKREFSPTREIRVDPDEIRSYSPPPQIIRKKSFSPSPEVRIPLEDTQHSYMPYGSLKTVRSKTRKEFSPTREIRVDQEEVLTSVRRSRPLGRSCSINQFFHDKTSKSKFSPTREIRISPKEGHSYSNIIKNTVKPDYSPTREVRISPKEFHSYGTAITTKSKSNDYSPTREVRISPKEHHSYAATIPRRSKPRDKSFSPTREIRTNPIENLSYSPSFPSRAVKDDSFSPTRETRVCPSIKQSYVPIEIQKQKKRRDSFSPTREVRIFPGRPIDQSSSYQSDNLQRRKGRPFSPTREVRTRQNRHSFPYTPDDQTRYVNIESTDYDDEIHVTMTGSREFVSPSRRRIQTVQKSESAKIIRASSLSSADDRSKRGLYYCSELSHSASSLNELESHERRCKLAHSEKFSDLHRFYSNIERHGQLEKATSATDLRPIRREGEILDFDEWRRIRAHQKAEKEKSYIIKKLKQDEREKDFLFRPKEIDDVKWKDYTDSGLRCKEKSVEDIRDNFEIKMRNAEIKPKSFEVDSKKDLHKPFWRGSSVADMATTMEVKYSSDKGWALKKKPKPVESLGLSKKLVSTLSKDQVHTIKKQLNEIYSTTSGDKIPLGPEKNENYVITVDKITKEPPGPLIVRCNSSITQEELLEPVLRRKEAKQKRYSPAESTKSVISKSNSSNSIKTSSEFQRTQTSKNTEKETMSPGSSCGHGKYTESSASEASKITVIHNDQPTTKDIKTTIKYFEEKKMEEPPKTIYHAREDSSPDEEEILKAIESKIKDRKRQQQQIEKPVTSINYHREFSTSVSDLKEIFGETETSRVNFRLPQPPPPPDESCSYESYTEQCLSLDPNFRECNVIQHHEQFSPVDIHEHHQFNSIDCCQFKDVRSIKEKFEISESQLKKSHSDPDLKIPKPNENTANKFEGKSQYRRGDVSHITHKFETKNSIARGRPKERKKSISPIPKISKKRDDRMMPHIDIISKTAALKQEIPRKSATPSPIPKNDAKLPSGEFDRIRYKFESPERSPYSQIYSSSPDISELRDISSHLSGDWIAHKYPKHDSFNNKPKKKIIQHQRPTSCSPPRSRKKVDIFANQDFDPSKHRPKARYVPIDDENDLKAQQRYTVKKG